MEINQESYNITYFLHKVKHELCFVNNLVQLNDTVYSVSLPVIDTYTKLHATDGRALLQRSSSNAMSFAMVVSSELGCVYGGNAEGRTDGEHSTSATANATPGLFGKPNPV